MTSPTPATIALATRGVSKSFGSLAVSQNIEIALPQGARYALIGPNGAGKTTLFNVITGVYPVSAGQVMLFGRDATGHLYGTGFCEGWFDNESTLSNLRHGLCTMAAYNSWVHPPLVCPDIKGRFHASIVIPGKMACLVHVKNPYFVPQSN